VEPERGRDRSRHRHGSKGAQQRSTSAIAMFQEHYRAQQRSAAAAAALVQAGNGLGQASSEPRSQQAVIAPLVEVQASPPQTETIYNDDEYYAAAVSGAEGRQCG
jgi:hypothetical protein